MRLYRFHMPDTGNDGRDYRQARLDFQGHVARLAGGFTRWALDHPAYGYWADDTGKAYHEYVHLIEFAVEDGKGEATRRRLVQLFKECFPDQVAVFSAEIGEAWIE